MNDLVSNTGDNISQILKSSNLFNYFPSCCCISRLYTFYYTKERAIGKANIAIDTQITRLVDLTLYKLSQL